MIAVAWGETQIRPPYETNQLTRIILQVCAKHKVPYRHLVGTCRTRSLAWPRQEAYYRCYDETGLSFQRIGRAFGNRDFSTIRYGVLRYQERMKGEENGA